MSWFRQRTMFEILRGKMTSLWKKLRVYWGPINQVLTSRHSIIVWILAVVYKFSLDAMYVWAASPQYAYAGLTLEPVFTKYVLSSLMYFIIFAILPKAEKKVVPVLLHLQFLFTVAPLLSIYALSNRSTLYMTMVFLCIVLQTVIARKEPPQRRPVYITGIRNYITVMCGVLVVFVLAVPVLYNGMFDLSLLNLFDSGTLYATRRSLEYPAGYSYIYAWITHAVLIFAMMVLLQKKKYVPVLLLILLRVLVYLETTSKAVLLIIVPILAVYCLFHTGHLVKILYIGFIGVCLITVLAYQIDSTGLISRLGIGINAIVGIRAFFHPADNKFLYYELFKHFPKLGFSEGMIGSIFSLTYPFNCNLGHVIVAWLFGYDTYGSTNTGYLGESYAQLGFLGMLLMSLLLGVLIRAAASYENKKTGAIIASCFSWSIIMLSDNSLLTIFFTGGILVFLVLFMIYFQKEPDVSGLTGSHNQREC